MKNEKFTEAWDELFLSEETNNRILKNIQQKLKPQKRRKMRYRKILIVAAVIVCLTLGAATYYIEDIIVEVKRINGQIYESIDYKFKPDKKAVGNWEVVDFVQNTEDFEAGKTWWPNEDFYWTKIMLYDNGKALSTFEEIDTTVHEHQWTRGYIVHWNVVPTYTIKSIAGDDYMFVQWKSGDYTIRDMIPYYYVFKKTSVDLPERQKYQEEYLNKRLEERGNDDPNIMVNIRYNRIYDTMDYEFVLDEAALGRWESVDFVWNIEDFNSEIRWFEGSLYWRTVWFFDDGKLRSNRGGTHWTKGYIFMDDVIPAYTIKSIDGDDYLFIQWKSGDYTIRGMKPHYYVFKRAE